MVLKSQSEDKHKYLSCLVFFFFVFSFFYFLLYLRSVRVNVSGIQRVWSGIETFTDPSVCLYEYLENGYSIKIRSFFKPESFGFNSASH